MDDLNLLDSYDYALPLERIALRPLVPRDAARLLRIDATGHHDHRVGDLPALLNPGDLLVFNDTRVIPARLSATRGAVAVSIQLHRQLAEDCWSAFAKPGKRLKPGQTLDFSGGATAELLEKSAEGLVTLRFDRGGADLAALIAEIGQMPLPPYIKRDADAQDRIDYQTLFAQHDGSVAAPTAGLHMTPALLERLRARGVEVALVTLHVGAGTFLPVKTDDIRAHRMHAEYGRVSPETVAAIARTKEAGGAVVAVGTTALRVLEAAAADGKLAPFAGEVDLFIRPGYRFQVIDRLMTNFHLPKSTLLMLVAALAGLDRVRAAYQHAVAAEYRFFSYGDACLIDRIAP